MKYSFKLILIYMLLLTWHAKAQGLYTSFNVQEWPAGSIVLVNGDSVQGAIKYHYKEDVINVLKEDGTVSSYSPVNVHHFIAKNNYTGSRQVFRTFYWDLGRDQSGFKKPTFFEQLNYGNLTLIMRETYIPKYSSGLDAPGQYGDATDPKSFVKSYFVDGVKQTFYVLMPDGDIKKLRKVRKDLLRLFGNKADLVKRYVKKNQLSYDETNELIAIVNYYNSL